MRRADAQHLALGVEIEPVAGLDLERRDALGQQRAHARLAGAEQLVFGGGARRAHGRQDAAAALRDLGVGGAVQPRLELVAAVAGVDDVRVAVDQSRSDPRAAAVDGPIRAQFGRQLGARAQPGDPPVAHRQRRIADLAVPANRRRSRFGHRREMHVGPHAIAVHARLRWQCGRRCARPPRPCDRRCRSADSSRRCRPVAPCRSRTRRSISGSSTSSPTPRAAGALTPGATAAGSTSRQNGQVDMIDGRDEGRQRVAAAGSASSVSSS